ncbi:MAG: CpaF family protein [Coriobacteriia bacterium]|nr:CpaF family protein [Coriobacteriia bacterium]MDR2714789.1 CpaF family protein [Coriobacteriales bacterium]
MSLRSYLETVDKSVNTKTLGTKAGARAARGERTSNKGFTATRERTANEAADRASRIKLRDALFERLPSEKIAAMIAENPARARREVRAVLEQLASSSAHNIHPAYQSDAEAAKHDLIREVADMVLGLGPLEELLADADITELMVNGPDAVFYERAGRIYPCEVSFYDERQLRMIIDRIVGPLGRRVDEQSPLVSARLPQGHRVNVVIPPLALDGPLLTIRKFPEHIYTLNELKEMGSLDEPVAQLLKWAVLCRCNIAVSGGTGGGKTTLLNALSVEIPHHERIITIEDAAELRFLEHPHVVRLEARPRNAEGSGEITIRDLVINALRMRPDRIVVGECRGSEALDMLQAMNTGHDGSLTTLHANSPREVIERLVMMARYAMDLPVSLIEKQIASALDLIVQLDRQMDGSRRITSICSCSSREGELCLEELATWNVEQNCYQWLEAPGWLSGGEAQRNLACKEVEQWFQKTGLSML